jgi:nitroimidazol reductase NimA-like FMN-containing flavoprotein (pyridoxamine 5'-phosphate oxidase superfamily)
MGIRLSEDEAWAEIERAHTGIFTSLKRDGWPVTLPTWFAVIDRAIYLRTPAKAKKVLRVRNDERGAFLVERGLKWVELAAVMVPVRASIVEDADEEQRAQDAMHSKYQGYRLEPKSMPDATKKAYGPKGVVIRLDAAGKLLTWDNARIPIDVGAAEADA